jgi:hypothetical protein
MRRIVWKDGRETNENADLDMFHITTIYKKRSRMKERQIPVKPVEQWADIASSTPSTN